MLEAKNDYVILEQVQDIGKNGFIKVGLGRGLRVKAIGEKVESCRVEDFVYVAQPLDQFKIDGEEVFVVKDQQIIAVSGKFKSNKREEV